MANVIKLAELIEEPSGYLPFKFDPKLWATKLPEITPPDLSCDDEFYDFEDYFDENNLDQRQFNLWDFSETIDILKLTAKDNSISTITNKDIAPNLYSDQLDQFSFKVFGRYVCCIFDYAIGQAGALGIWDTKEKNWCFWFSDELFCVEDISYNEIKDFFLGYCGFSHPMSPFGGRVNFEINKDRLLKIQNYEYTNKKGEKIVGSGKVFDWGEN